MFKPCWSWSSPDSVLASDGLNLPADLLWGQPVQGSLPSHHYNTKQHSERQHHRLKMPETLLFHLWRPAALDFISIGFGAIDSFVEPSVRTTGIGLRLKCVALDAGCGHGELLQEPARGSYRFYCCCSFLVEQRRSKYSEWDQPPEQGMEEQHPWPTAGHRDATCPLHQPPPTGCLHSLHPGQSECSVYLLGSVPAQLYH